MTKYLFFTWLLFIVAFPSAVACDVCGCGAGNYYLGMMPQFHKNFVGVRYRQLSYRSHLGQHATQVTQETFHVSELWMRYYPHRKIQLLAFLPWAYHQQQTSRDVKTLQGVSDALFMVNYQVMRLEKTTQRHSLWIGTGLKMPTGKAHYDVNDVTQVANPNFQLGTGSWDVLFNAFYQFRYQNIGISSDVAYKFNTKNRQDYQFGNRISSNVAFFYIQKIKNIGLMPNVGLYAERSSMDVQKSILLENTGGSLLAQTIGIEFFYKKLNIGTAMQLPLAQNLANGRTRAKSRGMLHVTWVF